MESNNKNTKKNTKYECDICAETLSVSKKVKCEYCDFTACKNCCRTYILDRLTPSCMSSSCGKTWTDAFISKNLNKSFMNTQYKIHIENLLVEQEKSLLPETQNMLLEQKTRKNIVCLHRQIRHIKENIKNVQNEWEFGWLSHFISESEYLNKLETFKKDFKKERRETLESKLKIEEDILESLDKTRPKPEEKKRKAFIKKCSRDECRGYLSSAYKCGMCDYWFCPDCYELKGQTRDSDHTCDPAILATVQILEKETKRCPNEACSVTIYKIDGCDQMWCTECHTAFSWKTGEIEKNKIHNPHYYEYMRNTGQQLPREEFRGNCELNFVLTDKDIDKMKNIFINKIPLVGYLTNIDRNCLHLVQYDLPKYNRNHSNEKLRISYLNGEITEEYFKRIVQQKHKKRKVDKEKHFIIEVVSQTILQILIRFKTHFLANTNVDKKESLVILDELEHLKEYANTCFHNIARIYSVTPLKFSPSFSFEKKDGSSKVRAIEVDDNFGDY
jgi:hypothetical protein